jgi:hypothetical protein
LWSAGATVDLEDALPPSPLANAFDEPNNLQDDSSQGTVLAAADHQQSQPSTLSYSTLPSNERWTTDNVQRLDLQLPPRSPNVFEQDDFTYLDRLRNGEQLQDALMAGPYTETQHEAANAVKRTGTWGFTSLPCAQDLGGESPYIDTKDA